MLVATPPGSIAQLCGTGTQQAGEAGGGEEARHPLSRASVPARKQESGRRCAHPAKGPTHRL